MLQEARQSKRSSCWAAAVLRTVRTDKSCGASCFAAKTDPAGVLGRLAQAATFCNRTKLPELLCLSKALDRFCGRTSLLQSDMYHAQMAQAHSWLFQANSCVTLLFSPCVAKTNLSGCHGSHSTWRLRRHQCRLADLQGAVRVRGHICCHLQCHAMPVPFANCLQTADSRR